MNRIRSIHPPTPADPVPCEAGPSAMGGGTDGEPSI